MAAKRFFYSCTIADFMTKTVDEIVGALTQADTYDKTKKPPVLGLKKFRPLKILLPITQIGEVFILSTIFPEWVDVQTLLH